MSTKATQTKKKQESQIERFKEKAKELGTNESGEAFELAFKKIIEKTKWAFIRNLHLPNHLGLLTLLR
jgi:hypothetical protein